MSAARAAIFWASELLPDVLELRPRFAASDPAAVSLDLAGLPGLDGRLAADGTWHGLWRAAGGEHRVWLKDVPSPIPTAYFVILPFDALLELRAKALLRFWRALVGRPPGNWQHTLPLQTLDRHVLILRALDARQAGASYRAVAEELLGFQGDKADWESDPRRNQVRRLVADGRRYTRGGYRELLHYPLRLPRRL